MSILRLKKLRDDRLLDEKLKDNFIKEGLKYIMTPLRPLRQGKNDFEKTGYHEKITLGRLCQGMQILYYVGFSALGYEVFETLYKTFESMA